LTAFTTLPHFTMAAKIYEPPSSASSDSGEEYVYNGDAISIDNCSDHIIESPKSPVIECPLSPVTPQLPPRPASAGSQKSPRSRRQRTVSQSASSKATASTTSQDFILRREQKTFYTAGRPPWYNFSGQHVEPFVIGICGGSASGKTTVANKIIEALGHPWVTLLSMDSFYKVT